MKKIYLVFGYGVPKNIFKDRNYDLYLNSVFNSIYDKVVENNKIPPIIICAGGKTDIFKPYKRTEGEEMTRLLKRLAKRPSVKRLTSHWQFIPEKRSISTLENFLNCKKILLKKKIRGGRINIFCEKTREKRIIALAKKIFSKKFTWKVIPIDFDVSPNRYLDPDFLAKKEALELKHDFWALKKFENLTKHHALFEDKISYFRRVGPKSHTTAIRQSWEKRLKKQLT